MNLEQLAKVKESFGDPLRKVVESCLLNGIVVAPNPFLRRNEFVLIISCEAWERLRADQPAQESKPAEPAGGK